MMNFQIRINYTRKILSRYVIFIQYIIYNIFNVDRHDCCAIVQLFVSRIKRCEKNHLFFFNGKYRLYFLL